MNRRRREMFLLLLRNTLGAGKTWWRVVILYCSFALPFFSAFLAPWKSLNRRFLRSITFLVNLRIIFFTVEINVAANLFSFVWIKWNLFSYQEWLQFDAEVWRKALLAHTRLTRKMKPEQAKELKVWNPDWIAKPRISMSSWTFYFSSDSYKER